MSYKGLWWRTSLLGGSKETASLKAKGFYRGRFLCLNLLTKEIRLKQRVYNAVALTAFMLLQQTLA